jgi:hypothetical protein
VRRKVRAVSRAQGGSSCCVARSAECRKRQGPWPRSEGQLSPNWHKRSTRRRSSSRTGRPGSSFLLLSSAMGRPGPSLPPLVELVCFSVVLLLPEASALGLRGRLRGARS